MSFDACWLERTLNPELSAPWPAGGEELLERVAGALIDVEPTEAAVASVGHVAHEHVEPPSAAHVGGSCVHRAVRRERVLVVRLVAPEESAPDDVAGDPELDPAELRVRAQAQRE